MNMVGINSNRHINRYILSPLLVWHAEEYKVQIFKFSCFYFLHSNFPVLLSDKTVTEIKYYISKSWLLKRHIVCMAYFLVFPCLWLKNYTNFKSVSWLKVTVDSSRISCQFQFIWTNPLSDALIPGVLTWYWEDIWSHGLFEMLQSCCAL